MSTKRLARELGLIRQRSQPSGGEKKPGSKQLFSYLIVIDFESTCWREKNNYGQEIIEFPAVLMNTTSGEIESEFHSYVQPQEHPVLSAFCTELTGITQTQVEAGVPLRICLSRFVRWLHQLQHEKGMVFVTDSKHSVPSAHLCAFVTWSDWDLGVCLLYECKRKQINKPGVLNSWIDLRATYKGFYSRKPKGLNGALQDLGIEFSGREHSGLDDARNTARLAWRMIMDCCVMKITKSLSRVSGSPSGPLHSPRDLHRSSKSKLNSPHLFSFLIASAKLKFNHTCDCMSKFSVSTHHANLLHYASVCEHTPAGSDPASLHLQHDLHNTHFNPGPDHNPPPPDMSPDPETPGCNWPEGFLSAEVGESGSYDDVLLEDEANVTGDQSHAPLSSSSNKWLSLPPHRGRAKITSPLCDCGRRAKHLTVCNGGPNHGRAFYSCTVRKNNAAGPTPHNGCGFFKWESALIESSLGQTSMSVSSTLTRAASRTFR
uniref:ERI1 exoribonuclease 2 n=1 Tax=Electrophorus electricus TaxID=8005 RepID=A0A4W4GU74_ELEEL